MHIFMFTGLYGANYILLVGTSQIFCRSINTSGCHASGKYDKRAGTCYPVSSKCDNVQGVDNLPHVYHKICWHMSPWTMKCSYDINLENVLTVHSMICCQMSHWTMKCSYDLKKYGCEVDDYWINLSSQSNRVFTPTQVWHWTR